MKTKKKSQHKPAFLSDDSSFLFNHSVSDPHPPKPSKKRKAAKNLDDLEEGPSKKSLKSTSSTFQDQEAFYSSLQEHDYSNFFLDNKADFMSLTRLSGLKYANGAQVLAAVNDKGPNGLYLVVNLSRNKKAFVSKEDSPIALESFSLGEFILGQIIPSKGEGKSTQLTIRPEIINEHKREYAINMVIWAVLNSEEDHGWTFVLGNGFQAFVKKNQDEQSSQIYLKNKPYFLRVVEKPKPKSQLLICEFHTQDVENPESNEKFMKKPKEEVDIKHSLGPGCLFKSLIAKVLENGLVVKFFGGILGFVYNEHLDTPLEKFSVNDRILATIIYFDAESKKIVLSAKKHLLEMSELNPATDLFSQIKEFTVQKKIEGGHYLLTDNEISVFLSKKQTEEQSSIDEKTKLSVKIKDFNYLDGLYVGTALKEFMGKSMDWKEIKVGDFLQGTIQSLKGNKLLISFKKGLQGVVDSYNFSDKPFQGFVNPKFKEGKALRVRVLSVDPVNKRLFLTVKPILLQDSIHVLKDISNIEIAKPYYGYISGKNEFGFIVSFFNYLKGMISFKHLTEVEKMDASSLNLGQTLKVYVLFVNKEKQKIGLSLTKPEKFDLSVKKSLKFSYEKSFEEFINNLKKPNFFLKNEEISVGSLFDYTIVKKPEGFPKDYLILESDGKEKKHRAIVHLEHLSDFPTQASRLMTVFEQNTTKSQKFQGILIGKTPSFLIVSLKHSLVSQYQNYRIFPHTTQEITPKTAYYVYIKKILAKGLLVSFHENLLGLVPLNKIEGEPLEINSELFSINKSLKVLVKSIKNDRILCSALKNDVCRRDHVKEFSYISSFLEQEGLILKSLQKQDFAIEKSQIGDYVRAEITHLKEYGVIVRLLDHQNLIGFIILENLIDQKGEYHKGYVLQARVLDIDYEKEIVDLKEVRLEQEKFEKLQKKTCYNVKKIIKHNQALFKKPDQSFKEAKILLIKDNFAIVAFKEFKYKVFGIVETRTLNDLLNEERSQLEVNGIIKEINLLNYTQISKVKKVESINFSNKINFIPIFTIPRKPPTGQNPAETLSRQISSNSLQIGQKVEVKLLKISKNSLVFQINAPDFKGFGRAHLSQFEFDPETRKSVAFSYKVGQKLTAKVLSLPKFSSQKIKENFVQLTFLESHLSLHDNELDKSLILPDLNTNFQEFIENPENQSIFFPAMVRSVAPNSINPLYMELSANVLGSVSAFNDIVLPTHYQKLNDLKEYFPEKSIHLVRIKGLVEKSDEKARILKSLQLSLLEKSTDVEKLEFGSLVIVKIAKIQESSLRVQISPSLFGTVDLLEVCDEFQKDPLHRFALNHYVPARVLKKTPENKLFLSLRESLVNERVWEILTKKGTLAYKKEFSEIEDQGDLRSRILKLGNNSLKTDLVFLGYIHQTNSKGCFIKISSETVVRAKLSELSDELVENPELDFYRNRLVIGRIVKIHEDGKIEASLKESVVKYGFPLELQNLKEGMLVDGFVEGFLDGGERAIVRIKGCRYTGTLSMKDSEFREKADEIEHLSQVLKKGEKVRTKILGLVKEEKVRIRLGSRKEDLLTGESEELKMEEKVGALWESIQEITKRKGMEIEEDSRVQLPEESKVKGDLIEEEEEEEKEGRMDIESSNNEADNMEAVPEDSEDEAPEEYTPSPSESESEGEDKDPDENDEEAEEQVPEETEKPKKKTKKQKDRSFLTSELEIRQKEASLLTSAGNPPQSSEDFERLLLENPNSSYVWISYLAHTMEAKGIESARELANRAVAALNFKSEAEKLNIWVAYLNLENSFGTESELVKVFMRALETNNPKKIYLKMLEIYRRSEKYEVLLALADKMIKKHKNSCKAWIEYLRNLLFVQQKTKFPEESQVKSSITRALQSLNKQKHLRFLSHYARLEFLEGNLEKGRTTFEAVVTNYPKRVDIWAMYLDLEIKKGTKASVRNLFERCISMSLKPKKMKFFFKRYLEFEVKEGNQERIEYVKQKANEYVNSILNKEESEEEKEKENPI